MKHILILCMLFLGLTLTSNAQTDLVSQYNLALDTVTNTATKYIRTSGSYTSFQKTVIITATLTKISGTVAGSLTLEYSLDGTNYYSLKADSVYVPTDVTSQTFGWSIKDFGAKYIRVKATGVGTMSVQLKGKVYGRKENS